MGQESYTREELDKIMYYYIRKTAKELELAKKEN